VLKRVRRVGYFVAVLFLAGAFALQDFVPQAFFVPVFVAVFLVVAMSNGSSHWAS
jgi:hypothetical protein